MTSPALGSKEEEETKPLQGYVFSSFHSATASNMATMFSGGTSA
jgi:hypothetical protein